MRVQAAALMRAEVQNSFARPEDVIELSSDVHPQRLLDIRGHPHQQIITRMIKSDIDRSKYRFIDYAVNLVYLPPVRRPEAHAATSSPVLCAHICCVPCCVCCF